MAIKDTIKNLRLERGFKQQYVADRIGVKQQTYQLYESGKRAISAEKVGKLAALYQLPVSVIYDEPEVVQKPNIIPEKEVQLLEKVIESKDKVIALQDMIIKNFGKKK